MEPERDIEKQLKAYAKKRREDAGAPMEMHPATRRMLQSEAARQSKQAPTKSDWRQTLYRFWPRLALTGSIFVLLAVGSWVLLFNHKNSETKFRVAYEQDKAETRSAGEPMRKIAPATQSPSPAETLELSAEKSRTLRWDTPSESDASKYAQEYSFQSNGSDGYLAKDSDRAQSNSPVPPTAPAPQPTRAPKQESLADIRDKESKLLARSTSTVARKRDTGGIEAKTPASATATASAPIFDIAQDKSIVLSDNATKLAEAQTSTWGGTFLAFSNANRNSTNSATEFKEGALGGSLAPADKLDTSTQTFARLKPQTTRESKVGDVVKNVVLDNFTVEKTGNNIRVVDGDGSTYTGSIQTEFGKPTTYSLNDEVAARGLRSELETVASNAHHRRLGEIQGLAKAAVPPTNNHFFSFQVSGTNLTLNQPVLFTGELLGFADTISITNSLASITNKAKTAPSGAAGVFAEPSSPQQLRGEAVVGRTNQIKIDALRVGPNR